MYIFNAFSDSILCESYLVVNQWCDNESQNELFWYKVFLFFKMNGDLFKLAKPD